MIDGYMKAASLTMMWVPPTPPNRALSVKCRSTFTELNIKFSKVIIFLVGPMGTQEGEGLDPIVPDIRSGLGKVRQTESMCG